MEETQTQSLITIKELKDIYHNPANAVTLRQELQKKLENIIEKSDWDFNDAVEHDYALPDVLDCLIYYVTGYISRHMLKHSSCSVCRSAFENPVSYSSNPIARLVNMKAEDGLIHPNIKLFYFIRSLENLFFKYCKFYNVYELILTDVLAENALSFPCARHGEEVMAFIIHYYMSMRMRQFVNVNNTEADILHKKMKFSKIT